MPVTTSAFILSFIRGIQIRSDRAVFFGMPVGIEVITTTIYNSITQRAQPDYQSATALSFAALALMFLLLVMPEPPAAWPQLHHRDRQGLLAQHHAARAGRAGSPSRICILFFALTVALPIGQLLLSSFFKFFGFYEARHADLRPLPQRLGESRASGAPSATPCCWAWSAPRRPWRWAASSPTSRPAPLARPPLIDLLAWLPWMMPGMVLGIGFLWGFAILPHGIPIYGTLWALLLAYIALGTPVAVRVTSSRSTSRSPTTSRSARA